MLLEIITRNEKFKSGDKNSVHELAVETNTDRYVSVIPESLRIAKKPGFDIKTATVDENPHCLTFIGKTIADKHITSYTIPLENNMVVRLLTEKNEHADNIDLSLFIDNTPVSLFSDIKIQRTNGLTYRIYGDKLVICFKYKKMHGESRDIIPSSGYAEACLSLFDRFTDDGYRINPKDNFIKEIKLTKRRKDVAYG